MHMEDATAIRNFDADRLDEDAVFVGLLNQERHLVLRLFVCGFGA